MEKNCPLQKGIVSEPTSRDLAKTCTRFLALSKPQSIKLWRKTHPPLFVLQIWMIPQIVQLVEEKVACYTCKRSNLHLAQKKKACLTLNRISQRLAVLLLLTSVVSNASYVIWLLFQVILVIYNDISELLFQLSIASYFVFPIYWLCKHDVIVALD